MKVKKLQTNWHQNGSTADRDGAGEWCDSYEVGRNDVYEIQENEPRNGLQAWNYIIKFKCGKTVRAFNPNCVVYFNTTI